MNAHSGGVVHFSGSSDELLTDAQSELLDSSPKRGVSTNRGAAGREVWVVTSTKELRHLLADAAHLFGVAVHALDWTEAGHRLTVEGVPSVVVVTDWDLRINPTACRAMLARGARVLILRGMTIEGLDHDVLEHSGVEVLPLTFELDAFGEALRRLHGQHLPRLTDSQQNTRARPIVVS